MPSVLIGNPVLSGPQIVISGWQYSGNYPTPYASVLFRLDATASGNLYIGLSGGTTQLSGGMFLSGGGLNDGMLLRPGGEYSVPRLGFQVSGVFSIYVRHDAACSGQARLYYEVF